MPRETEQKKDYGKLVASASVRNRVRYCKVVHGTPLYQPLASCTPWSDTVWTNSRWVIKLRLQADLRIDIASDYTLDMFVLRILEDDVQHSIYD